MEKNFWNKIDKLEELAGKATQGEWEIEHDPEDDFDYATAFITTEKRLSDYKMEIAKIGYYDPEEKENPFVAEQIANADYIAAANPQTIREMIAELRRLEKEADWLAAILAGNLKIQGKRDGLNDPAGGHKDYWRNRVRKAISEDK